MRAVLFLLILASGVPLVLSCLLCPLRIPPKPKPLDQFRLPSIQKILETKEAIQQLCYDTSMQVIAFSFV